LTVEKNYFILSLSYMQISTYLRPSIHQNSPKLLGVKS
jgi:hypothetical protein